MSLSAGMSLGPYEIQAPAGSGGMGEVYKARDVRLDRTVAIKILPSELADNSESRQRLEREARTISKLSHPHICALYDIGHQEGTDFLVMEYVEGETLEKRLLRGFLPTEQVLKIGIEIAGALDKAHRQGITHRDLKLGNIMLTKSGAKLLDFGLAKLKQQPTPAAVALTEITAETRKLTAEGMLVGTFQYMAPEQLEGKEADARTDVFALGAVLYEMATARPAFTGKSRASLIAAILSSEPPPITQVRSMSPLALDHVVKTCLAKDPDDRWQSAADVARELKWISQLGPTAGLAAPAAAKPRWQASVLWGTVSALLVLAALALGYWMHAPQPGAVTLSSINLSPDTTLAYAGDFAVSPDGRQLILVASVSAGPTQLWMRSLDTLTAHALVGTEGASYPFWSPDSRYIGFFADGKLKKIEAAGGPAQTVCPAEDGRGGTWSPGGVIVFAPGQVTGLFRVSSSGGTPIQLTRTKTADETHRWPHFLPDGKHVLFFKGRSAQEGGIYVLSLDSPNSIQVENDVSEAVYAEPGYLVFWREGNLVVQPFDTRKLRAFGEAAPLAEGVLADPLRVKAAFSLSQSGLLVYQGGSGKAQLTWLDLDGNRLGTVGKPGDISEVVLSPDGKRALVDVPDPSGWSIDLWLYDLTRGVPTRMTFGRGSNTGATWSPDGRRFVFTSTRNGFDELYLKAADGRSVEQLVLSGEGDKQVSDWSPDGKYVAYSIRGPKTKKFDIWILPINGDRKPHPFIEGEGNDQEGQFSPDGRWFLYRSDESGRAEIYVVPFPGPGGRWQVSSGGTIGGGWIGNVGILYFDVDGRPESVQVDGRGADFKLGSTRPIFSKLPSVFRDSTGGAITRDGRRALIALRVGSSGAPLTLMTNWSAELKK